MLATHPIEVDSTDGRGYHAKLLPFGEARLRGAAKKHLSAPPLKPGIDYAAREPSPGEGWLPFPENDATAGFRHTWVMRRRRAPVVPDFGGSPWPRTGPGEANRTARILLTYFHPWTLNAGDATLLNPLLHLLRRPSEVSWAEALQRWFAEGVLHTGARRYMHSFLTVTGARPPDVDDNESAERN